MDERKERESETRQIIMIHTFGLLRNHIMKIGFEEASRKTRYSAEYLKDVCMRRKLLSKDKIIEITDILL